MSKKIEPRFARTVLAVSIAAIGASAQSFAWAADSDDEVARLIRPDSQIEAGIGYVSKDSAKFGEYNGLQREGAHVIGNVSVVRRGEDGPGYVEVEGRNLGLDTRNLKLRTGEQGNYGVRVEYDEIQKLWSDSYQTPFLNAGSTNLTLPAGWVKATSTAGMTQLNASMHSFDVGTKRKAASIGMGKELPAGWDVDVSAKHEKKEGTRFIGATFGTNGGNPRAAILPEPVDYTTDQIEALLRYTGEKLQMQFGYYGSFFQDANNGLTWSNPYSNSVWSNLPVNQGRIGLPPDNQLHQLSASAGYTVTKDTRVSGSLSFGRMTQNDAFLPYTVNSGLTVTNPLPRNSLDGRVDTTHADLKLSSKLMPKLQLTAGYRYDDRDNKTSQATYNYIGGDSMNQAALGGANTRINLPGSSTKQQIDAELDYHATADTKLKFGYDYEWAKKTFEAIKDEREGTIKAEVHQHFNEMLSGGLGYAYSDRKTSAYDASAPFLATTPSAVPGTWDNVPTQFKFFMAPRKRDKVRAFVNFSPRENIDLQLNADLKDDDYHESQYGLKRAKGWAVNFDANVVASETLSGHFFTSWDSYATAQRSIALGGSTANVTNTANGWTVDISDRTFTIGTGVRYTPAAKYQLGADLTHATSIGRINVATGTGPVFNTSPTTGNTATPLPNLVNRLARLDMFGSYELKKDVTLKVKYIYERYRSADWAYDQVTANTLANVIGTNQTSPNYNVQFLGVSVAYQF